MTYADALVTTTKQAYSSSSRPRSVGYHLRTLWLFSRSNLKTVVLPQTVFGCVALVSREAFGVQGSPEVAELVSRLPLIISWVWINLFGEVVANQRLAGSIVEDSINKPWRPLPSKRVTPNEARSLLLWILLPSSYIAGVLFGGSNASVALMVFSYMYNDLDGANENWLLRNILNACGLSSFSLGAAEVAWSRQSALKGSVYTWIAILAAVISSTVQLQDLPDIDGDKARGRRTMPLTYGDTLVRWSICIPTLFRSFCCPFYWGLHVLGFFLPVLVGLLICGRLIMFRCNGADAITWKMWCGWMGILYLLPLIASHYY
jgi:4-hydroxybenzoate polyprenyltransferase